MYKAMKPRIMMLRRRLSVGCALLVLAGCLASMMVTTQSARAQTFATLHSFDNTDGSFPFYPIGALVQGTNGLLYGTTHLGAENGAAGFYCGEADNAGCGSVFQMTPSGTLTTLYSFCSQPDCADGEAPTAGLIQAANGYFYGTTQTSYTGGLGTVFKISPGGTLTTLYTFCVAQGPSCPDGDFANGLIQATNGDFYGTTQQGGSLPGTIFKLTLAGILTTLHSFCSLPNCADGSTPTAALIQATNGDLYGTTSSGGANNDGTVFKITPAGALSTLHSFDGTDGEEPTGPLLQATNGDLYGTTYAGGAHQRGTAFRITPGGKLTTLYNFCAKKNCTDGSGPRAGVIQGTDGNFYGITDSGGATSTQGQAGTVFKLTPNGKLTTLYSFCADGTFPNCPDGYLPAGLMQSTNGEFYGATIDGGANGDGSLYSLSLGLAPFIETQPASAAVGGAVMILGTDLTDASGVTFDGTAAVFTIVSASEITTTVPTGATTGAVQVVTAGGTLTSNVSFTVKP